MNPEQEIAREIAAELLNLYLPEESPDIGRGRRFMERCESRIATALASSVSQQWQPIDENTPKQDEIIGMEENGNIASVVWLARKDCWVSPDGAYGYAPRWWLPRSALPVPPVKEK